MNVPALGETSLNRIIQGIRDLARGGTNAIGFAPASLAAGASETLVEDAACAPGALVLLTPLSASAAAAQVYLKEVRAGAFVLGHAVSAATDRQLRYEIRRP